MANFAVSQIVGVRKDFKTNLLAKYDNHGGSVGDTQMDGNGNRGHRGSIGQSDMGLSQMTMAAQVTNNLKLEGSLVKIREEKDEDVLLNTDIKSTHSDMLSN